MVYPYNRILFVNKKKVPIHATTQMNIENMLNERSQTPKGHVLYDSIYMKCPGQAHP